MKRISAPFSRKQELIHGLIHGIGVVFGVCGIPVLAGLAAAHHNTAALIGAGIYGFSFMLLFTSSMVYHLALEPAVKRLFEIFDHISIYFLIAGTYTPFILVYLNNEFGRILLAVLWGLTILGIFFKIWFTGKFGKISTIIYLLMGWMMISGGKRFFSALPHQVIVLLMIGAGLYSVGVAFYVWGKRAYTHAIWHGLVLIAAICHYVAVLLAM